MRKSAHKQTILIKKLVFTNNEILKILHELKKLTFINKNNKYQLCAKIYNSQKGDHKNRNV